MKTIRGLLRMAGPISQQKIEVVLAKEAIPEVKDAKIHHTAYRIKDPIVSLDFYSRILGMRLQSRIDIDHYKTTVFFMGYGKEKDNPPSDALLWKDVSIELFHIWGSESQPSLQFCHGNDNPKGYCHVALHVPDVCAFAKRVEPLGVKFIKKPDEGNPRGQAFIQDPDGYYIELISELTFLEGEKNQSAYEDMFKL